MVWWRWLGVGAVCVSVALFRSGLAAADEPPAPPATTQPLGNEPLGIEIPLRLSDEPGAADDQSVYGQINVPKQDQGVNSGGVNLDVDLAYLNHYVYRGVDYSKVGGTGNTFNFESDGRLTWDLGKYPHPFVGLFNNIFDSDPVSRFQEVRPYVGADVNMRPFLWEVGYNAYIYPQREAFDTAEFYARLEIDDSLPLKLDHPLFSPYIYGAYDFQRNNGWYFEAGLHHDFEIPDVGLKLSVKADLAYIVGFQQQFVFIDQHDTGWQHYDVGLTASYPVTNLLNITRRYGELDLKGYFFYTGRMNNLLQSDNVLWGGAGLEFKY
jgi:hypothetical protein